MPYPLKTSDIRRFLAANGHTSWETEYCKLWHLRDGRIHIFEDAQSALESKDEWTRAELIDKVTDNEIIGDNIVEWVEKNPEKGPSISELPLLQVLTAINERYPLPTWGSFKGTHALMLSEGKINLLIWIANPNKHADEQVLGQTIGDIGNDTLAELFQFIDTNIIPKPNEQ